ncbi:hypothetical protein ACJ73_06166 [Blastomyces percursus]|uniref:Uncharacterized protein n=1 Tax=Blastomyces percursus TaxID=1658174 RepID=A0A1J9Q1K6_9EURO|nr:hypothetical protein ACJ73_06166 [Blastomyces percursus]
MVGGELVPRRTDTAEERQGERREPARRREKLLIFSTEGQVPDAGASEMSSNGDAGGGDGRKRWWWLVLAGGGGSVWVVVVRRNGRKRAQRRRDRIPVVPYGRYMYAKGGQPDGAASLWRWVSGS